MGERPVYLNNAATAWPRAPGVAEIPEHPGRAALQSCDPSHSVDPLEECQERLAAMFSVRDPRRIILCSNATHALNQALPGQNWKKCSRVITSVTEHNSVLRPLAHLKK